MSPGRHAAWMGRRADVAADWGGRLRSARLQRGASQRDVAAQASISQATWSRMEIGSGGAVPLGTWVEAADVLGLDLVPPEPLDRSYDGSIDRLMETGGWRAGGRVGDARWFDRDARRRPGLRTLLPAERAVVRVVSVLVDEAREWARLGSGVETVRRATPSGFGVSGLLLVVRTSPNRRRTRDRSRRSDGRWLMALRDPGAAMPLRTGWVWLAPRGTHLLPGG